MDEPLAQALIALLKQRSHSGAPWASARVIAPALGCSPDHVVRTYRALQAAGVVEVADDTGDADGTMARYTQPAGAAEGPAPARPAHPAVIAYEYDAFVSYAGEDRDDLVMPLVAALEKRAVRSWVDARGGLGAGDTIPREINDGLVKARCGVIVASPDYITKPYPRAELDALLHRAILDEERPIYPILHRMTRDELMAALPLLAARVYIDSAGLTADQLANQLVPILKPPALSLRADVPVASLFQDEYARKLQKSLAPQGPVGAGAPTDALPEPAGLEAYRPFFEIEFQLAADAQGQPILTWTLRNLGPGLARNIRVFLPGVLEYEIPRAVGPDESDVRSIPLTQRYAYHEYMKPPLQAVVESEDYAANIYRQYGSVDQLPKETDDWRVSLLYVVPRLGRPYLVPQRIVNVSETDRFRLDEPLGWHTMFPGYYGSS